MLKNNIKFNLKRLVCCLTLLAAMLVGCQKLPRDQKCTVMSNAKNLCLSQGIVSVVPLPQQQIFLQNETRQLRGIFGGDDKVIDGAAAGLCFKQQEEVGTGTGIGTVVKSKFLSGEERIQIGLKLKAQNTCNVLYIMWRIWPVSEIVVSKKINLKQSTHKECQNHGYTNLARHKFSSPPTVGRFHSLLAHVKQEKPGGTLVINADGEEILKLPLDADVLQLQGPAGMRSDNGQFLFFLDTMENTKKNCSIGAK